MAKEKISYACSECGAPSRIWKGQCSLCSSWNTLEAVHPPQPSSTSLVALAEPVHLAAIPTDTAQPISTSLQELDAVLGGGIIPGSVTLLAGDPGIGKSTFGIFGNL